MQKTMVGNSVPSKQSTLFNKGTSTLNDEIFEMMGEDYSDFLGSTEDLFKSKKTKITKLNTLKQLDEAKTFRLKTHPENTSIPIKGIKDAIINNNHPDFAFMEVPLSNGDKIKLRLDKTNTPKHPNYDPGNSSGMIEISPWLGSKILNPEQDLSDIINFMSDFSKKYNENGEILLKPQKWSEIKFLSQNQKELKSIGKDNYDYEEFVLKSSPINSQEDLVFAALKQNKPLFEMTEQIALDAHSKNLKALQLKAPEKKGTLEEVKKEFTHIKTTLTKLKANNAINPNEANGFSAFLERRLNDIETILSWEKIPSGNFYNDLEGLEEVMVSQTYGYLAHRSKASFNQIMAVKYS